MKEINNQNKQQILAEKKVKVNNKPQNKDDMDSRVREEQHVKGEHVTNNKKEKKKDKA